MLASLPNDESMRQDDRARGVAVLIADPHHGTRSALHIALKDAEAVQVVGDAPDVPSAIAAVSRAHVDIVLADSRIAGLRSESARAGLAELSRRLPVIVMGMSDPRAYTAPLRTAGAAGYWPKDGDLAQLTELLSAAATATPPYRSSRRRLLLPRND
jgi:DNA-binding NarL/FixJ family response regulator